MGELIVVDFRRSVPPPHDFSLVWRLGRQAAAVLTRHTGVSTKLTQVGTEDALAEVSGLYALTLQAGSFCPRRPDKVSLRDWHAAPHPRELGLELHADVEWLVDHGLAASGTFGREFYSRPFSSAEEVAAWLRQSCLRAPVERVSAADVSAWKMQRVRVPDEPGTALVEVSLADAIRRYGAKYGHRINPALLEREQFVSPTDARAITEAVRRVLPKRKA